MKRYLYVDTVRQLIDELNAKVSEDKRVKFKVVLDRSLLTPRYKELHNVIEGKNCCFVAATEDKHFWRFEMNDEFVCRDTLVSCFEKYAKL